ncbi:MAG: hypothetical protein ACFCVF_11965 [Kineosporiaceae bacterium]
MGDRDTPAQLPPSAVMVVVPLGVAVAFARQDQGSRGVGRLLRFLLDPRGVRPRSWFWPVLLSMPSATLVRRRSGTVDADVLVGGA